MLLAVTRPHARGRKGNIHPRKPNVFDRTEYSKLKGKKITASGNGTWVATWLSGCGTTRGAGSTRILLLDVEERGLEKPFSSVSCRRVSWGAALVAAAAMGSSAGSPSKKRAIAICDGLVEASA